MLMKNNSESACAIRHDFLYKSNTGVSSVPALSKAKFVWEPVLEEDQLIVPDFLSMDFISYKSNLLWTGVWQPSA